MERGVKHRPRRRSPLPFLLLAVAVVGCAFAVAVAAVVPMEADSHGGQDQALPTPTLEEAERDKLDAPAAATPTPTPAPYIPDEAEVEMLARLIWGEARGIPSDMHKAAVVWCALNRVDAEGWPDTVAEVVTQPHQFAGYSPECFSPLESSKNSPTPNWVEYLHSAFSQTNAALVLVKSPSGISG